MQMCQFSIVWFCAFFMHLVFQHILVNLTWKGLKIDKYSLLLMHFHPYTDVSVCYVCIIFHFMNFSHICVCWPLSVQPSVSLSSLVHDTGPANW